MTDPTPLAVPNLDPYPDDLPSQTDFLDDETPTPFTAVELEAVHDPQRWYAAFERVSGYEASKEQGRADVYRRWRAALSEVSDV